MAVLKKISSLLPVQRKKENSMAEIPDCPKTSHKNPVKAIRKHCLECVGNSSKRVLECASQTCALFPFREGKNPFRAKRELTDEQKAAMGERLQKALKAKIKQKA